MEGFQRLLCSKTLSLSMSFALLKYWDALLISDFCAVLGFFTFSVENKLEMQNREAGNGEFMLLVEMILLLMQRNPVAIGN